MTIKAVKPGGYGPNFVPSSSELAQLDERIVDFGLDSTLDVSAPGAVVTGTLSLQQQSLVPGIAPTIEGSAELTAPGSTLGTGPGGGSLVLKISPTFNYPTYVTPRTRRVRYSALEVSRSAYEILSSTLAFGSTPSVDAASGGASQFPVQTGGFAANAPARMTFPLTKLQHGATITSVIVYYVFYFSSGGLAPLSGQLSLERVNVGTGVVAVLGTPVTYPAAPFPSGTSLGQVLLSGLSEVVSASTSVYRVVLQEPLKTGGASLAYTGIEVNYAAIQDEEPQ